MEPAKTKKTFGTLAGVFTPTTLTILGVIMFIRQPWVVGNAGITGAILILLIAVSITLFTALSLSSITTNIRIGAGGAFSLIAKSLGLEIGGAIGIPFYFAQAIAVAMYVFGFREGIQTIFPEYPSLLIDLCVFLLVMIIAFISTGFAFKIQFVIMGIIFLSILSIYGGLLIHDLNFDFVWLGQFPGGPEDNFSGTSFWVVFAVFFPAVTGVMAGANMSGDLTNPRKSIPRGTLSAVGITTIIYFSLIFVAALLAPASELVSNYTIFIDYAFWPPIVLAGLLGATFSSAIGSFVGAPRILLALGEKNILPKSNFLSKTNKHGEPHNAMWVTVIIVAFGLSLRDLNAVAPLITMFFMITYAMVNVVALIEQSLALPSFRPSLKIPLIVPLLGTLGSLTVMFIINAFVALVSLILIVSFYFYLVRKQLPAEAGDSRSGLFTALAEWATKKSNELSPSREVRSWRPDLLIPVRRPKDIRSAYKLIETLVYPKGSIKLLAFKDAHEEEQQRMILFMNKVVKKFSDIGLPTSYTFVSGKNFNDTLNLSMQALNTAFFKPNTVFSFVDQESDDYSSYEILREDATMNRYAIIYYIPFGTASLAIEKNISVWLEDIPQDWKTTFTIGNNNLVLLSSLLIRRNWKGSLQVNFVRKSHSENSFTGTEQEMLSDMVRLPKGTQFRFIGQEEMKSKLFNSTADLNVFSMKSTAKVTDMVQMVNETRTSAIFCNDSGFENALV